MPTQENEARFTVDPVTLLCMGFTGSIIGGTAAAAWEMQTLRARNDADQRIENEQFVQDGLLKAGHSLEEAGLGQTPSAAVIDGLVTQQTQKVETLIETRPVVHENRDVAIGMSGGALILATLGIAYQYKRHQINQQRRQRIEQYLQTAHIANDS